MFVTVDIGGYDVSMRPSLLITAFVTALVFSIMSFMTVAAVLPDLKAEWLLNDTEAGLLGGIFFAGYVAGVLVLASLTDRFDPKIIYIGSAVMGGVATILIGVLAEGLIAGLVLRFIAGVGMAGTYMPGLRGLTDTLDGTHKNKGLVYYTSFFALGSGLSVLVSGEINQVLDWRWAFILTGAGFFAAAIIVAVVLPPRPPLDLAEKPETHPLDFRPVIRNREVMAYIVGVVGATWEVFAYRVWAPSFLMFLAPIAPSGFLFEPTVMATAIAFIGIPASAWLGQVTEKIDRRKTLIWTSLVSITLAILIALNLDQPYWLLILLALALGMTSYGRNAATTAGMMAAADPKLKGMTMAFFAAVGFLGGVLGPFLFGVAQDVASGGVDGNAWSAGFLALAFGGVVSVLGLTLLGNRKLATGQPAKESMEHSN